MTDRDDWLEWRRGGIGGSDIAALMGISPWASPWSVWADKSGLLPDQPENEYMTAGRWLERAIGPWFENITGLYVAGEQMWCTHRDHDWSRCTPDGFVFEGFQEQGAPVSDDGFVLGWFESEDDRPHALGCYEVKVTGPGKRYDPIPPYYQAQGQWQMYVTDMPKCFFAVLHGRRLEVYELDRDDADIEFMVERAECFWRDHVLAGIPPATDASEATERALKAVYPFETPGMSKEVSGVLIDKWVKAKAERKLAEKVELHIANALRAGLAEAEEGTVDGVRVVSLRSQSRHVICPKCNHDNEAGPFRVLRYHKPKESR